MIYIVNATLIYTVKASTPSGFDPITGAPIFADDLTGSVELSLEEANNANVEPVPGVDRNALFLDGRAVAPPVLVPEITRNTFYPLTITLLGKTVAGKIYLLPRITSRLNLDNTFGEPVQGWFVT